MRMEKRKCLMCGKDFQPLSGTHKYCGNWWKNGCAIKRIRMNHKAWKPTERYWELRKERLRKNNIRRLKIRFEVFFRDKFQCQYCGRKLPEIILEIDHIHPKSQKGPDKKENYITSCRECNIGKGDRILS